MSRKELDNIKLELEKISNEKLELEKLFSEEMNDLKSHFSKTIAELKNDINDKDMKIKNISLDSKLSLLPGLLEIVDQVYKALSFYKDGDANKVGLEMISKQFESYLSKLNIHEVPTDHFDSQFHQAIEKIKSPEHKSGDIIYVEQKGYMCDGRVLRYATVKVCE